MDEGGWHRPPFFFAYWRCGLSGRATDETGEEGTGIEARGWDAVNLGSENGGRYMADINGTTVTVTGLSEFEAKLQKMRTDNPGFERRLRGVIRKILGEARAHLREDAASGLQMDSDPRHAYKAVRFAVYKKLFGGQVNIFNSRKAGASSGYEPPRTLRQGQRGGNRRPRTSRNLNKYEGVDRGFILRWLNDGMTKTDPRVIEFTENDRRRVDRWNKHPNTGNRGAIKARKWFKGASLKEIQEVAGQMQELIDNIINEEFV